MAPSRKSLSSTALAAPGATPRPRAALERRARAAREAWPDAVYDPDAPSGTSWWHWMVSGLPANATEELPPNAGTDGGTRPARRRAPNSQRLRQLRLGRCAPPPGDKPHRYVFTVHALSVPKLEIPNDATAALARLHDQRQRPGYARALPRCTAAKRCTTAIKELQVLARSKVFRPIST